MSSHFWNVRTNPINTKQLLADPEALKQIACQYFEWCVQNPLIAHTYRNKDNQLIQVEKLRPFTQAGLCAYLGCSRTTWASHSRPPSSFDDTPRSEELFAAVDWINVIIYEQKFSGAAAGLLNTSIISRELRLGK